MPPRDRSRLLPYAIAALLLLLLGALATLQYRWIGRVSALESQRMKTRLAADGNRFIEDFDRELTRAFFFFHPGPDQPPAEGLERAARQYERWQAEAPMPEIVKDVFAARRAADGRVELSRLDPRTRRFEPAAWPDGMEGVRQRFSGQHTAHAPGVKTPFQFLTPVDPRIPGLVLPLNFFVRHGPGGPHPIEASPEAETLLVVRLDERVIAGEILPELTRRHFGSRQGTEYTVAVLDSGGRPIFVSDPAIPAAAFRRTDIRLDMMELRPFQDLRAVSFEKKHERPHGRKGEKAFNIRILSPLPPQGISTPRPWQLAVQHRQGSLENAVAVVRRHNLVVSVAILTLIAATSGLMVVTTQRAQRLARQQIEFVAAVTHELHTPLTAIRSAGQNLADGVVADPQQVKRYGSLILHEGRRLSDTVGQVLELAGIQSGRRAYNPRPEEVAGLVDGALDDCRLLVAEKGARIEREIPSELPPVLADGPALRRALRNLIENAIRHGGPEGWVGLSARRAGDRVEITVADHGPGIRREDLPHLFEPFYRGRDALANGVPGSGLGLSVVRHVMEALGGRVTVAGEGSGAGRGTAFTLHLRAAAEPLPGIGHEKAPGSAPGETPA